jgi:hypothetical protein
MHLKAKRERLMLTPGGDAVVIMTSQGRAMPRYQD